MGAAETGGGRRSYSAFVAKVFCLLLWLGFAAAAPAVAEGAPRGAEVVGVWAPPRGNGQIEFAPCDDGALCGVIVASDRPEQRDVRNPDPKLRDRRIVGSVLFRGLQPGPGGAWVNGRVYNPKNGRDYAITLTPQPDGALAVRGCLVEALQLCRTQIWRRAQARAQSPSS